jgi:hypothetical protein
LFYFTDMETALFKRKAGQPLKHDFSGLNIGESVKFKGKARNNPYPYAAYWNSRHDIKIEVLWDSRKIPYARRIV